MSTNKKTKWLYRPEYFFSGMLLLVNFGINNIREFLTATSGQSVFHYQTCHFCPRLLCASPNMRCNADVVHLQEQMIWAHWLWISNVKARSPDLLCLEGSDEIRLVMQLPRLCRAFQEGTLSYGNTE